VEAAAGVWTELRQHRGKVVAKGVALPCCGARAAFEDSSVMTVQFLFFECKRQSTGGNFTGGSCSSCLKRVEMHSRRMAATRITLPCCASAAFDDNSSVMTVQFLFFGCKRQSAGGTFTGGSCSSCLNSVKFSDKAVQRESDGNSSRFMPSYAGNCFRIRARQSNRRDN